MKPFSGCANCGAPLDTGGRCSLSCYAARGLVAPPSAVPLHDVTVGLARDADQENAEAEEMLDQFEAKVDALESWQRDICARLSTVEDRGDMAPEDAGAIIDSLCRRETALMEQVEALPGYSLAFDRTPAYMDRESPADHAEYLERSAVLAVFDAPQKKGEDTARLDWLQAVLTPNTPATEIFLAGLRSGPTDATAFQVEIAPASQPSKSHSGKSLREAIDAARLPQTAQEP